MEPLKNQYCKSYLKDPVLTSSLCAKRNKQTLCKATRARNLGWNDSFEIGEIEISNLDSTALSKLTGYSVNRKQGIENKSACGIWIPKLAYKMSEFLCFLGDWKLFTKIYGIFRVPENALRDS